MHMPDWERLGGEEERELVPVRRMGATVGQEEQEGSSSARPDAMDAPMLERSRVAKDSRLAKMAVEIQTQVDRALEEMKGKIYTESRLKTEIAMALRSLSGEGKARIGVIEIVDKGNGNLLITVWFRRPDEPAGTERSTTIMKTGISLAPEESG